MTRRNKPPTPPDFVVEVRITEPPAVGDFHNGLDRNALSAAYQNRRREGMSECAAFAAALQEVYDKSKNRESAA